jgi:GT2 family glycosyltransferase
MTPWNLLCRIAGLTRFFPSVEFFNGEAYGAWPRDRVREVDIVSGCFLLIPRSIWLALGGFDPLYFMYGEEADLCLRARRIGARPLLTPEAGIIHYGGASEKARTAKMVKLLMAKTTLIDRHWHVSLRPLGRNLLALWPASRALAFAALAAITGRKDFTEDAKTWREVWTCRDEWRLGYASRPPIATQTATIPLLVRIGSYS